MSAFERIGTDRQLQDHWIRRLIAGIIDSIIIGIIASIISVLVALPALILGAPLLFGAFPFLSGVLFFLYASFMESSRGTTFGKEVMNLKVTTKDGKLPSIDRAVIRDISKIYWVLWLIDTLIGMATPGDPHQKYSDRFAGTTVVSTISTGLIIPTPPSPPQPPTSPSSSD
jgi:uncharacterized RDD family membrane protein YckC